MPAGQSRQITTTFAVPAGYAGPNPISNTSTVTTTVADQDPTDNQATATTPVAAPSTDLAISKTGPASVTAGASVTYAIHVTNHGPSDATGSRWPITTPSGLMFVGNTGDCTTTFPCALGTIPAGQTRTILTTFAVPLGYAGPDTISNTATVVTTATDVDPANNSASATTAVIPPSADLSITKTGDAAAGPGDTISYVLKVANLGPSDAQDVLVSDPTPAGLMFVSNSGACTTPFPCSLGALASGETRTHHRDLHRRAGATSGSIVNTATVSASTVDPLAGEQYVRPSPPRSATSHRGTPTGVDQDGERRHRRPGRGDHVRAGRDQPWSRRSGRCHDPGRDPCGNGLRVGIAESWRILHDARGRHGGHRHMRLVRPDRRGSEC